MITILGPTASGKTNLAVHLAKQINGEVISADSRQIYRGMDIGTGKDLSEYTIDGITIPYHLIDIHPAGYEYNVFQFQRDFLKAYNSIQNRGAAPILCGGSGLYLESVLKGYQMLEVPPNSEFRQWAEEQAHEDLVEELKDYTALHNSTDLSSKKRTIRALEIARYCIKNEVAPEPFPDLPSTNFGLHWERDVLKERITQRLKSRIKEGMIEEVENLLRSGLTADQLKFYGLEYKFITELLEGTWTQKQFFDKLNIAIHQFSKRQMTWFRKMEKSGIEIHWLEGKSTLPAKLDAIQQTLKM